MGLRVNAKYHNVLYTSHIIALCENVLLVRHELHQVLKVFDDVPAALGAEPHLCKNLGQLDQKSGEMDTTIYETGWHRIVKIQCFRDKFPAVHLS